MLYRLSYRPKVKAGIGEPLQNSSLPVGVQSGTMTRRELLHTIATAPALGAAAPAFAAAAELKPVRFGGPTFLKTDDPRELAREHRRLGYSAAYTPKVALNDTARQRAIEDGFRAEDVVLAEVGVWVNLLDADAAKRAENLQKVTDGLAIADAVGARCCVDIAGSYHPTVWYGPDPKNFSKEFFDASVENARKIIDGVKPKRSKFTYEMMGWSIPDSPDSYLKLIRAVDRPAFGVHLDVCNVVSTPERFYNNAALIHECFTKLGKWIVSCHAKDLDWLPEMNVHFVEVIPGRGKVDYTAYLTELAKLGTGAPLMLEHLKNAAEYDEGRAYIQKVAAQAGVKFA
jgi:sugar phosphate isomerase/epimerase